MTAVLEGPVRGDRQVPRTRRTTRRSPVLAVPADDAARYTDRALHELSDAAPELSAGVVVTAGQKRLAVVVGVLLVIGLVLSRIITAQVLLTVSTLMYAGAVGFRYLCFRRGASAEHLVQVPDAVALAVPDADLPRYTVLVPAYREPQVISRLLERLESLDYPRDRLEVLVLLEDDDTETLAAVRAAKPASYVKVVVVPESQPRTKPKACNYGLQLATGDLVTIYDAEDEPERLQLRRAAVAFSRVGDEVACLQAILSYHNAEQNRITRWFTAEYLTWFAHFLPGLVSLGAPVPLGGTSNHMRAAALRELHAWDPNNVTEDADLGMRLYRHGMRTLVLDSVTYEEANSDFVNWVKQRSRWYKGYLQTWLVHVRRPRQARQEFGWRGLLGLTLFVGGTPTLAALNPLFWTLTIVWFVAHPHVILVLFPWWLYFPAMFCWIFGNLGVLYMNVYSVRIAERQDLAVAALTSPAYWVMMAIAAVKAFVQLVTAPTFWEKTVHGLDHLHLPHRASDVQA